MPSQDGEYGSQMQHVRIQMRIAKSGRAVYQLLVDPRLFAVRQRVRHLDDDHAVEQRLILLFLQKSIEFCEIGMFEDGFIKINQWKSRNLDVLFLRHRQQ